MINPIQWLRANYARNLADYREPYKVTPSEAARILGSSRDRDYEKRRRETTDAMREKAGLAPWIWKVN